MTYTTYFPKSKLAIVMAAVLTLSACGGSGGGGTGGGNDNNNTQNQVPTANAGSDITANEQTSITLTGSGSDSDGTINTYNWTQTSGTTVELANANSASATFTAPDVSQDETLTFELKVTDNDGATATDSVTVTINMVNLAPTVNAGEDQSAGKFSLVNLSGEASDADGEVISYQWTQTSGQAVELSSADTLNASFTPTMPGDLTFELSATDNQGMTATDSVNITVIDHDYALLDGQTQANEYLPGYKLDWSIENFDRFNHTLTWEVTTDAPLEYSILGTSEDHPYNIAFNTLAVAQNTDVTVSVTLDDGENSYNFSRTVTMLPDADAPFVPQEQTDGDLVNVYKAKQMQITDINNDGLNDVIYSHGSTLRLMIAQSDNSFNEQSVSAGFFFTNFNLADINSDGSLDILIDSDTKLAWISQQEGSFVVQSAFTLPENAVAVLGQVGDIDNDNDMDIVVLYRDDTTAPYPTPKLGWFEQKADGFASFANIDELINNWESANSKPKITLGDFNNDGKTDIIVATASTNDARPVILYAQTDDGFNKSEVLYLTGSDIYTTAYTTSITTIDINQDGFDDLVSTQSSYSFGNTSQSARYHVNQKDGTFATQYLPAHFNSQLGITKADIDGDGDTDIVIGENNDVFVPDVGSNSVSKTPGHVSWVENTGEGFTGGLKTFVNNDAGQRLVAGDIDNDGDVDVINAHSGSSKIWFFENVRN